MRKDMLHLRRIKVGSLLFLLTLFYVLVQLYKIRSRPGLEYGPAPTTKEYRTYPVYEYTSIYRLQYDPGFEASLDKKLVEIESAARNSGLNTLIANHTLWQIASPREKPFWSSWITQWSNLHRDWAHVVYMSPPEDLLNIFRSVPEVGDNINNFPTLRKDLIRYLLLWYHGGLYAGIDTWSRVAMEMCPPASNVIHNNSMNIGLMIGVEIDEPFLSSKTMKEWGWVRAFGFSQDVVWAPRRFSPLLRTAIVRSISHARTHTTLHGGTGKSNDINPHQIEEISGVGMFTDIVFEFLSNTLSKDHNLRDPDAGIARRVTWKKFTKLKKPIWINGSISINNKDIPGLAILPINVWSNGQQHSNAGSDSVEDACINQLHAIHMKKHWQDKDLPMTQALIYDSPKSF